MLGDGYRSDDSTHGRSLTIVSGPIDSGKTSWCRHLAAGRTQIAGVLLAKVYRKGERIGYDAVHLSAAERVPFARTSGHEPQDWQAAERIGIFTVSGPALRKANAWLTLAAASPVDVIVDEIGPLELQGGGLSAGLRTVLASRVVRQIYVVIRSTCVKAVCDRFGIEKYTLVEIGSKDQQ